MKTRGITTPFTLSKLAVAMGLCLPLGVSAQLVNDSLLGAVSVSNGATALIDGGGNRGYLLNSGASTVSNGTYTGYRTRGGDGAGGGGGMGGVFFVNDGASLTLNNVNFVGNSAIGGNGGGSAAVDFSLVNIGTPDSTFFVSNAGVPNATPGLNGGIVEGNRLVLAEANSMLSPESVGLVVRGAGVNEDHIVTIGSISADERTLTLNRVTNVTDGTANDDMFTVGSASGFIAGASVTGTGIAANTTVSTVSGTTITLSQNATGGLDSVTVSGSHLTTRNFQGGNAGTTTFGLNDLRNAGAAQNVSVVNNATTTTFTVADGAAGNFVVGSGITGTGVPAGTTITSVVDDTGDDSTITISREATQSLSTVSVPSFSNVAASNGNTLTFTVATGADLDNVGNENIDLGAILAGTGINTNTSVSISNIRRDPNPDAVTGIANTAERVTVTLSSSVAGQSVFDADITSGNSLTSNMRTANAAGSREINFVTSVDNANTLVSFRPSGAGQQGQAVAGFGIPEGTTVSNVTNVANPSADGTANNGDERQVTVELSAQTTSNVERLETDPTNMLVVSNVLRVSGGNAVIELVNPEAGLGVGQTLTGQSIEDANPPTITRIVRTETGVVNSTVNSRTTLTFSGSANNFAANGAVRINGQNRTIQSVSEDLGTGQTTLTLDAVVSGTTFTASTNATLASTEYDQNTVSLSRALSVSTDPVRMEGEREKVLFMGFESQSPSSVAGVNTVTLSAPDSNAQVGYRVLGDGVPDGTRITSISANGRVLTLTNNLTSAVSAIMVTPVISASASQIVVVGRPDANAAVGTVARSLDNIANGQVISSSSLAGSVNTRSNTSQTFGGNPLETTTITLTGGGGANVDEFSVLSELSTGGSLNNISSFRSGTQGARGLNGLNNIFSGGDGNGRDGTSGSGGDDAEDGSGGMGADGGSGSAGLAFSPDTIIDVGQASSGLALEILSVHLTIRNIIETACHRSYCRVSVRSSHHHNLRSAGRNHRGHHNGTHRRGQVIG